MNTIEQLLDRIKNISSEEIFLYDISEQLLEPFGIKTYELDQELFNNHISFKTLYSKTDFSEKYGIILKVLLLDNKPIFFFTQSCKWLNTYVIYHISDELTNKYIYFLQSCQEKDHQRTYMTKELLNNPDWFGKYGLFNKSLPIIEIE